jgi:hypothetical protein
MILIVVMIAGEYQNILARVYQKYTREVVRFSGSVWFERIAGVSSSVWSFSQVIRL